MKTYILSILALLVLVVSCREEAVPKPDDLLSKEQMAAILYDVTLVNSIKGVNKQKLEDTYLHLDSYLYAKHETDSLQFKRSNDYYAANPTKYFEIYGIVQAKLTKERKKVGEALEAEQKRRDSIQDAKKIQRSKIDKDSLAKKKPEFTRVRGDK
ncbi:uncharacterized protein DUF4296 [Kordia periserrulae]|uniref:Uncharacterized protein DUF4296 n=1 Tax=Kordia periserrulae TaxID=701523 RepID=A0A2T6BTB4_9FLAO|nr:DUF4296 domain-containing protein [Kordia periserrulae]PTX59276.1 uncharacterized protein DUF4296 [Kordia periserrulae]